MSWQHYALMELAHEMGRDNPNRCWILTDFDTWHLNPFYTGPMEPHPETGDIPLTREQRAKQQAMYAAFVPEHDDDIPF